MKRAQFIKSIGATALIGLPILSLVTSCYNSGEDDPVPVVDDADCLANGTNSSISANHGHSLTVSKDDVNNGVEKSYEIEGSASHPHTVTISSSQFNSLKSNTSISIDSTSNNGHTHSITVGCA